jgi:hypothetical protein
MQELSACMELFAPLAKKGKVIGGVGGNHEARHYRTTGLDMTRLLFRQLQIEHLYSQDTALIFLRFGEDVGNKNHHRPVLYTIYLTHGSGGGRKEGGKIQRLVDLATVVDADCYVMGHTHLPATLKTAYARPSAANSSISYCTKLYVNSAAKLSYGGYGDIGGYKPNAKDTPRIVFSVRTKDMRAIV